MPGKRTYEELESRIQELEKQLKGRENREYKSRLFSFIFGREENKKWTLSLYNAIHGTSYDDVSCITINTIGDVVYMGMKNDLSILVSETVSLYKGMELYEQQSTYNPNMPLREFMYAGKLYDKYVHSSKLNQYGKTLLPLPLPKLVVFYNGEEKQGDETVLCLSDAFKKEIRENVMDKYRKSGAVPGEREILEEVEQIFQDADPDIEVKVRMFNINHGHNRGMLGACRPLGEYAWFVAQIRKNLPAPPAKGGGQGIGEAIDRAIDEMPGEFEIRKFITENRAEVKDMCLTEYDEAETMELFRAEGRTEGREEGIIRSGRRHLFSDEIIIRDLMEEAGCGYAQAREILRKYDHANELEPV